MRSRWFIMACAAVATLACDATEPTATILADTSVASERLEVSSELQPTPAGVEPSSPRAVAVGDWTVRTHIHLDELPQGKAIRVSTVEVDVLSPSGNVAQRLSHKTEVPGHDQPGYQPEVRVQDLNFDGRLDFALHVTNAGSYGAPTFVFYIYDPSRGRFEFSATLTEWNKSSLDYQVDPEHRWLVFPFKSGCCYHTRRDVGWEGGIPASMREQEWDELSTSRCVHTIKRRDRHGRWRVERRECARE